MNHIDRFWSFGEDQQHLSDVSEITFQTFFVATLRKLNIYTQRGELELPDEI